LFIKVGAISFFASPTDESPSLQALANKAKVNTTAIGSNRLRAGISLPKKAGK